MTAECPKCGHAIHAPCVACDAAHPVGDDELVTRLHDWLKGEPGLHIVGEAADRITTLQAQLHETELLDDALAEQIETALGTPGGKTGGFPARIEALQAKLERYEAALEFVSMTIKRDDLSDGMKIIAIQHYAIEAMASKALEDTNERGQP